MVNGESTDWLYGARGAHDYTLEVSVEKAPPAQLIPELVSSHIESVLDFYMTPALRGKIVDAQGQGVVVYHGERIGSCYAFGSSYWKLFSAAAIRSCELMYRLLDLFRIRQKLKRANSDIALAVGGYHNRSVWWPEPRSQSEYLGWLESSVVVALLDSGAKLALYRIGLGEPQPLEYEIEDDLVSFRLHGLERIERESRGF